MTSAAGPYGPVLTSNLTKAGVPRALITRFADHGLSPSLLTDALGTTGLRASEDAVGLLLLADSGLDDDEILAWARLGSLEAGSRLFTMGIPIETVRAFPMRGQPLTDLVRMHQAARRVGISPTSMLSWVAGGVMTVRPPYVNEQAYATWRATGVHHMGMHRASLACAAGLSPTEAVTMFHRGALDDAALTALAGLRVSAL